MFFWIERKGKMQVGQDVYFKPKTYQIESSEERYVYLKTVGIVRRDWVVTSGTDKAVFVRTRFSVVEVHKDQVLVRRQNGSLDNRTWVGVELLCMEKESADGKLAVGKKTEKGRVLALYSNQVLYEDIYGWCLMDGEKEEKEETGKKKSRWMSKKKRKKRVGKCG